MNRFSHILLPKTTSVSLLRSKQLQISYYHVTRRNENSLIYGGLVVAGSAMTLKYGLQMYQAYQASRPNKNTPTDTKTDTTNMKTESTTKENSNDGVDEKTTKQQRQKNAQQYESFFASWFSRKFYEGGFEAKMTKREAALILGVRESATADRIKDAHRRILLINHPDRGGSAYLSAKVNEAKDLLIKGKQ